MISFWQGEREFFEARVTGDSPADLVAAVQHMVDKCRSWNGDDTALTWSIENEAVVLRFPGASSSSGWDGK